MKFGAKASKHSKPYWHIFLIFFVLLVFMYVFNGTLGLKDLTPIIVAAIVCLVGSYIFNNQYSVVSIINGNVSFGSRGMVHGNFKMKDVVEVKNNIKNEKPHIAVITSDDSRFTIPIAGFNESEVEQIIHSIKS